MSGFDPVAALKEEFGDDILRIEEFRGEITVVVDPQRIVDIATFCRDELDYEYLADIAGVDYFPAEPRLALNYHILSLEHNHRLRLKAFWDDGEEPLPSVTAVWPSANWEEREAYDMFGIQIKNHPDLRRILMPDEWEGHPQRKDYPLGYETVQFSFNVDEVNKHKPYAKK
jgi:NADH-quinone oxidoreductase subunit C